MWVEVESDCIREWIFGVDQVPGGGRGASAERLHNGGRSVINVVRVLAIWLLRPRDFASAECVEELYS